MPTTSFFNNFKIDSEEVAEQLIKDLEAISVKQEFNNVDDKIYEGEKLYHLFLTRKDKTCMK